MMHLNKYRVRSTWIFTALGAFLAYSLLPSSLATAQVLVENPFITSYQGWVDPVPARGGNWRISLINPTIMETANTTPAGSNPPPAQDNGSYFPMLLVQDNYVTPSAYNLNARMYTSDDDLFGLVFGYQNPDNYFRVGMRFQTPGNLGGTSGLSVQKVVNGVVTQISPNGTGPGAPVITDTMFNNHEPIDVRVAVNGMNYEVFFNNTSVVSGTDPNLAPGKIGVQSWAQRNAVAANPHWGTELETISVTQGANTLYSGSFNDANLPVQWRPLLMTNSNGLAINATGVGEDVGSFGADINDAWYYQQTNGFEWATSVAPNTDFIGPAVVVDEPGSTSMDDYEMRVRLGATDDDGIGVLVRAQDDNNFYRINFATQTIDATNAWERAPRGLSVQKVQNGVWTELFRDNQTSPLFVYQNGGGTTPASGLRTFDLRVGVLDNQIKVTVRDSAGNVIRYPIITDNTNPLLTGTVGLTTWGTDNVYYTSFRGEGGPLVTELSTFTEFDLQVDRNTGNVILTNNSPTSISIRGLSLISSGGALIPANWLSVAENYDEAPDNGSVDPDDPWTVTSSTSMSLSEAEQSGGNGGTLAVGQSINFGSIWTKSRIEDLGLAVTLADGTMAVGEVAYVGGPGGMRFHRSDLNTDSVVNASDWPLFYPNLLADLSSLSDVGQALAGDLDGDGDNDIDDFSLFKSDFDSFNGAGAFQAMLANVPEPTSLALLIGGAALLASRRRARRAKALAIAAVLVCVVPNVSAAPVDLTTYTPETFIPAGGFPLAAWTVTPTSASLNNNADMSVLYSPDSALNKRFIGRLTPGTDDDVVGFVIGFEPGDAQLASSADYVLIDWKGATQNFQFTDGDPLNYFHHDLTADPAGYNMPLGLALSRVSGSPNADEFWQHFNAPENPNGGVTELARGATLGSTGYSTTGSHVVDITYTPTNVTVRVDGVEQFNVNGSFPDGRFGLYSAWQGPTATFSNFEVVPSNFGISATVDRGTGQITLRNVSTEAVTFDYYQLTSPSNSLNVTGWNSLSDQNFQAVGAEPGQSWDEAGGSDSDALGEAFLQSHSTLNSGASVNIGSAYNGLVNGEDLTLTFRLPSGLKLNGVVEYVGTPPVGLSGDYNGNGRVDAADYVVWRKNPAGSGGNPAGYNTWRANFGRSEPGSGAALGASNVPEPSGLLIVFCVAVFGVVQCTRQRGA
jgi:hypothetical protein